MSTNGRYKDTHTHTQNAEISKNRNQEVHWPQSGHI